MNPPTADKLRDKLMPLARKCWALVRRERLGIPFFLGASVFWSISVIVHLVSPDFSGQEVSFLTWTMPLASMALLIILVILRLRPILAGLTMVAGIWSLGPWFMLSSATFGGAGFTGTLEDVIPTVILALATTLVPILTFNMSAYDGTLFALLLATGSLPIAAGMLELIQRARLRACE